MKNWTKRISSRITSFMYGRNGQDQLGFSAYLFGTIMYIIALIAGNKYVLVIAFLLFFYGIFRSLSKNIVQRRIENQNFLKWIRFPKKYITMNKLRWENRDYYKYFMCSQCRQIIRVPKGKGKIEITCPKCGRKFIRRT